MFGLLQDGSDGISYQLAVSSNQQPYTVAYSGSSPKSHLHALLCITYHYPIRATSTSRHNLFRERLRCCLSPNPFSRLPVLTPLILQIAALKASSKMRPCTPTKAAQICMLNRSTAHPSELLTPLATGKPPSPLSHPLRLPV